MVFFNTRDIGGVVVATAPMTFTIRKTYVLNASAIKWYKGNQSEES